jgi:type IV pilus assembly protein PilN
MARINLLPWRAQRRKQQQKDFLSAILLAVAFNLAILFLVRSHFSRLIEYQTSRNQFLTSEITALDQNIREIESLESKKHKLIARMEIIQQLQVSRPEIVHLFDELARTLPEGVFINQLTQVEKKLTLTGIAQSNARVSAYMHNLESSAWLKEPLLNIIETKEMRGETRKDRASNFTLLVRQASDKPLAAK